MTARAGGERPEPQAHEGEPDGWRPIETAPADGSYVLVWCRGQVIVTDDGPLSAYTGATHWMPLPPPPTAAGEGGEGE